MELLIGVFAGAAAGFFVAQYMYLGALARIVKALNITEKDLYRVADEMGLNIPKPEPETVDIDGETYEYDLYVEVRVEKEQDMLYAYRDDTDEFLAQDRDPHSLVQRLTELFPARTRVNIDPRRGGKYLQEVAENG
jgi:hypothetical protein